MALSGPGAGAETGGMAVTVVTQRRPVEPTRRVPVPVEVAIAVLNQDRHRVIGSRLTPGGGDHGAAATQAMVRDFRPWAGVGRP